jgi:predicted secreted Zn-dependent protease
VVILKDGVAKHKTSHHARMKELADAIVVFIDGLFSFPHKLEI